MLGLRSSQKEVPGSRAWLQGFFRRTQIKCNFPNRSTGSKSAPSKKQEKTVNLNAATKDTFVKQVIWTVLWFYTPHSTPLDSTLCPSHFSLHTLHITRCTLHTALDNWHSTLDTSHHPLHSTLYTYHFTLHTLHFTLWTWCSTLCTLHPALYTHTIKIYIYIHLALHTSHSAL